MFEQEIRHYEQVRCGYEEWKVITIEKVNSVMGLY